MAQKSVLKVVLDAVESYSETFGTSQYPWKFNRSLTLLNGIGVNEGDLIYPVRLPLAAAPTDINLDGALMSQLDGGQSVDFAKIRIMLWESFAANGETLTVGAAGASAFEDWLAAAGDALVFKGPGIGLLTSPDDGWTVTPVTGDVLRFDPGAASFNVDVFLVGTSA